MRKRSTTALVTMLALLFFVANLAAAPPQSKKKKPRRIDGRAFYGYGPFEQADKAELEPIGEHPASGEVVRLLRPAAQAFLEMQQAALQEGIWLIPVSGFRDNARQTALFRRAVRKYGSQKKAARWVAAPGFSHHEAGLAIDLGDGTAPECRVRRCFRKTAAYEWLRANAERFGFQLNQPRNPRPGPPREPWHWRFTGPTELDTQQAADQTSDTDLD
ncbi:MAG TPA: D-alanyl-D-alanine carboxypeptidase family protein [Candidatus Acidoferrales bacterium]|nr:D-alanyl-D-alanine carboxypeptidase family protein [Candidatus Acidoferrales bacterium]